MRLDWFSRDKGSLKINNLVAFSFFFFWPNFSKPFCFIKLGKRIDEHKDRKISGFLSGFRFKFPRIIFIFPLMKEEENFSEIKQILNEAIR